MSSIHGVVLRVIRPDVFGQSTAMLGLRSREDVIKVYDPRAHRNAIHQEEMFHLKSPEIAAFLQDLIEHRLRPCGIRQTSIDIG